MLSQFCRWAKLTVNSDVLNDLLPGPVTTVFERRDVLNERLNPGATLVGIRIPDHTFLRRLVRSCGYPLVLTSANLSNHQSTLEVEV